MTSAGLDIRVPPLDSEDSWTVQDVKVKLGGYVHKGQLVATLASESKASGLKVKSEAAGNVDKILLKSGEAVKAGQVLMRLSSGGCQHPTIMKNMCAECGADLEKETSMMDTTMMTSNQQSSASASLSSASDLSSKKNSGQAASIAIVHSIPELKVSSNEAQNLGKEDERRLLKQKRLVLLVDLDQTLIHTTNENIPPNLKGVYHFQLYGPKSPWYHTRIRPGTAQFLKRISQFYELHICTFGARLYAHTIASFLDHDSKFFSHRILSRDECFDSRSKTANLSSLFPCGDHMVCIIDDREDVWNYAANLVHVKPYNFFKNTGDINAPPGCQKTDQPAKGSSEADELYKSVKSGEGDRKKSAVERKADNQSLERRQSIDMPTIEDVEGMDDDKKRDADDISIVSDDLEMSDDSSSSSSSSSSSDTKEEAQKEVKKGEAKANLESKKEAKADSEAKKDTDETNKPKEDTTEETNKPSKEDTEETNKPTKEPSEPPKESKEKAGKEGKEENEGEMVEKEDLKTKSESSESSESETKDDLVELEDTDDYLLYLEDILKTIHKAYYDLYEQMPSKSPDLKTVIPYVKRKVLQGTTLVFSGLIPTHAKLEKTKPYMLARSLGAKVHHKLSKETTHLVAARIGTAKVNEARKLKTVRCVTPDWLWCCAERWEKADERLYTLYKAAPVTLKPPAHCSSPEIAFAERCPDAASGAPSVQRQDSTSSLPEAMNPFLAFSSEDLKGMDKEVEDILSGDSSDSEDEEESRGVSGVSSAVKDRRGSESDQDDDSLTGEYPRGRKRRRNDKSRLPQEDDGPADKFKRGEAVPSDYEIQSQSDDDEDGDGAEVSINQEMEEDESDEDDDDDNEGEEDGEEGDWTRMGAELEREFLGGSDCNSNSNF